MCELSFAKCVCLLFILVNVAILSSFGFRIDSDTVMPSVGVSTPNTNSFTGHKLRHSRKFHLMRPIHSHQQSSFYSDLEQFQKQQDNRQQLRQHRRHDLQQDSRQDLQQYTRRELQQFSRHELQQDTRQELQQNSRQELQQDNRRELQQDSRQQLQKVRRQSLQQARRQMLQQDMTLTLQQEMIGELRQEPKHHIASGRIEMSVLLPPPLQPYTLQDTHISNSEESYLKWPLHIARPQRSPSSSSSINQRNNNKSNKHQLEQHQKQQRKRFCQEKDVARNAYIANTVVLARAESMSSNRVTNYSVTFRILKKFKSKYRLDDTLRLTFLNENNKRMHCEPDPYSSSTGNGGKTRGLVKAKIQQSKEYYLFLNSDGMHRYTVQGMPVLKRKKLKGRKDIIEVTIKRITDNKFVLKEPNKPIITRSERLKLGENMKISCHVKGFPIPYLTWKKDGVVLRQNESVRITYKRRKTTLKIIKVKTKDFGRYECIATGLDSRVANESVDIQINREECAEHLKDTYCLNGGTCYKNAEIQEAFCVCGEGFAGDRCQQKEVMKSSIESSESSDPD